MTAVNGIIPIDDNGHVVLALWNDATGQAIPVHVKSTTTGADGKTYALLDTGASGGGGGGGAVTDVVVTGTITADQGAVTATFGAGVASWSVDARGTFSAGTTLNFEYLLDAGGDWLSAYGVTIGSTGDVAATSVVGGAPISYQGNGAGFQKFRVRAHPFAGGDSIAVTIVGSVATDGGFVSKSLPPGSNVIGKTGIQVGGADVSVSNPIPANILHGNLVDAGNSSTATLTANSIFTGTAVSGLNYSALALEAYADVASAAGGLQVLQSQDNVNFDLTDSFTVAASTPFNTVVNLVGQYYKVKYTNGGTNQGTFRLQAIKQAAESVLPRTLSALGNLKVALQEDNTAGLATSANQSTGNTSLASIVTNTTGVATQTTLAAAKSDLDSIVTNTTGIATAANQATSNTNTSNTATVLGATGDAAVTGDNPGTISAKQRGLSKILADMWDSANHWLQVKVMNANANGQNTMLNSAPVVIASDQSNVPVSQQNGAWTSIYKSTQTGVSSWAGSGDLTGLHVYKELMITCNLSALTGTSVQFVWDRKDGNSVYVSEWFPTALSAVGTSWTSIGAGLSINHVFGDIGRLRINAVSLTSATFTVDVQGR